MESIKITDYTFITDDLLLDNNVILDNISNNNGCIELVLTYCKAFTKIPKYMINKEYTKEVNLNMRVLSELFYSIKFCSIKSEKSNKISLLLMDSFIDVYSINEDCTTELLIHTTVKNSKYKEAILEILNILQERNTNIVYDYKETYKLDDSFNNIIKQISTNLIFYEDTYISNTKVKEENNTIEV